jgi:hypothetical protein
MAHHHKYYFSIRKARLDKLISSSADLLPGFNEFCPELFLSTLGKLLSFPPTISYLFWLLLDSLT